MEALGDIFPGSTHVRLLGLDQSSDEAVWQHAKKHGLTIVTQDSDFNERGLIFGYPPKIVWLQCGNSSTHHILNVLKQHHTDLLAFENDPAIGCFEIY